MVKKTLLSVLFLVILLIATCAKVEKVVETESTIALNRPIISLYEALGSIDAMNNYNHDFKEYIGYAMGDELEKCISMYGASATWTNVNESFSWYIQSFRVGKLGISMLINIAREDQLGVIFDIFTFYSEGKQPHFGTLWEPVDPPGSQGELPYRLGVYYYGHPNEIKAGIRIKPDYLIDMQDQKLLIHEPSGADEKLFLYQDPGPM